jgi:diacylglycerol kinase (ATP)
MPDDGNFKGHGGKPGRKSKVVSMSAHKNRHGFDSGTSASKRPGDFFGGRRFTGLTLFDFSPETDPDAYTADEASGSNISTPSLSLAERKARTKALLDSEGDLGSGVSEGPFDGEATLSLGQALPCENSPFETPGREQLRWGLEPRDEGSGPSAVSGDNPEYDPGFEDQSIYDKSAYEQGGAKAKARSRRERKARAAEWRQKTGSSGSLIESFFHAINGLAHAFAHERNVRIHCGIAGVVLILALGLRVDAAGCLAIILATGFVLFAEYINTAIEHVTDIQANFRYHPSARLAKDTAAAAVVIAAFTAVLVGAIVFTPRLWALICGTI